MVKRAISKMKFGKAAGPSGVLTEMIRAAGETGATMIHDLVIAQSFEMGRSQLTGSRASSSVFTRERLMLWTEATIAD